MLNLIRLLLLTSRKSFNSRVPGPWDETPNSEAATVSVHSFTVDFIPLLFTQNDSSNETAEVSVHSVAVTFTAI